MKISVDIDGVLADFTSAYAAVANRLYPGKVPAGYQPSAWDWPIITPEEDKLIWQAIDNTEDFWMGVQPHRENVRDLQDFIWTPATEGVEVYFVTSRESTVGHPVLHQTQHWLNSQGLIAPHTAAIPVNGSMGKVRTFAAVGIQFSIDDRDKNVMACLATAGPAGKIPGHKAYLLDRAWNRAETSLDPYRLPDLKTYLDIVREAL
jgi:hypothetical protein